MARAKKGGEQGANGEWYEGGKFIATTERPKGSPNPSKPRRFEIEPFVFELAPSDDVVPIYPQIELFCDHIAMRQKTIAILAANFVLNKPRCFQERSAELEILMRAFNAGERWVKKATY